MSNANEPMHPARVSLDRGKGVLVPQQTGNNAFETLGLSKREHFAGLAMNGLIASGADEGRFMADSKKLAAAAVKHADTLLAELDKGEQGR